MFFIIISLAPLFSWSASAAEFHSGAMQSSAQQVNGTLTFNRNPNNLAAFKQITTTKVSARLPNGSGQSAPNRITSTDRLPPSQLMPPPSQPPVKESKVSKPNFAIEINSFCYLLFKCLISISCSACCSRAKISNRSSDPWSSITSAIKDSRSIDYPKA